MNIEQQFQLASFRSIAMKSSHGEVVALLTEVLKQNYALKNLLKEEMLRSLPDIKDVKRDIQ